MHILCETSYLDSGDSNNTLIHASAHETHADVSLLLDILCSLYILDYWRSEICEMNKQIDMVTAHSRDNHFTRHIAQYVTLCKLRDLHTTDPFEYGSKTA